MSLIFIGHFLRKSPIISGSCARKTNDVQLKASYESSPPCIQDKDDRGKIELIQGGEDKRKDRALSS